MGTPSNDSKETAPFILNTIYPDATEVFAFRPEPLESVLQDCIVVLDTNSLLVPYNTGKDSLQAIRNTYESLITSKRLVVPGQVAREFARHRPEKLKDLHAQLIRQRNISLNPKQYPLLESLSSYQALADLETALQKDIHEYQSAVMKVLDDIRSWNWNDPVSELYRELFTKDVVYDLDVDRDELQRDLDFRFQHKIPPGYKDATKDDNQIGDLAIWRTILDIGKAHNRHLVFVSGELKPDWWHRSENQTLYPRFELSEEFRKASSGKSFYIIQFSELLRLFKASDNVVKEISYEERAIEALDGYLTPEYSEWFDSMVEGIDRWLNSSYQIVSIRQFSFPQITAVSIFDKNISIGVILHHNTMIDHMTLLIEEAHHQLRSPVVGGRMISHLAIVFIENSVSINGVEAFQRACMMADVSWSLISAYLGTSIGKDLIMFSEFPRRNPEPTVPKYSEFP